MRTTANAARYAIGDHGRSGLATTAIVTPVMALAIAGASGSQRATSTAHGSTAPGRRPPLVACLAIHTATTIRPSTVRRSAPKMRSERGIPPPLGSGAATVAAHRGGWIARGTPRGDEAF